ncbi:MAG: aminoglycoside phosphotransferase family protein [Chloroflexi bacterium]|nr:aminoglycoside phosphotransferase family protein [Chloroflexota bacterium]
MEEGQAQRKEPCPISVSDNKPATNVDINVALVRRLVAAQFPQWAHLPIEPVEFDGHDNRTFHLGKEMSVRLPSAQGYVAQVEKEHLWLPRLAPLLPLPIPTPLAMGLPGESYPWRWSVYRWLDGEIATIETIADLRQFATALAEFLTALQRIDPTGGPPAGPHSFYRGGPLAVLDAETRQAIAALESHIDADAATDVWEAGLSATWHGPPVWLHGDVAVGNLLVKGGRLSAVIDFGCSAVGDPACDLTIAWTLLSGESREGFRAGVPVDGAAWARGRGWALWKGLITLAEHMHTHPLKAKESRRVIDEVLADHKLAG